MKLTDFWLKRLSFGFIVIGVILLYNKMYFAPWIFLGSFLGIITGLLPGLHVNTLGLIATSFVTENSTEIALMIIAMSIVHSFVDFIPSILFSAPDTESFLTLLPGHRFLLKGRGSKAIKLTIFGGIVGAATSIMLLPIFAKVVDKWIEFISDSTPILLIGVIAIMILSENKIEKKFFAGVVILLAGMSGLLVLNRFENGLFPLITGFFALPGLIFSLKKKQNLRKQKITEEKYSNKTVLGMGILSSVAAGIVSLMPAIGPSQAAFIVSKVVGNFNSSKYLVLLGGINTANLFFSLVVLYLIGKTRTGTAVFVKQLIDVNFENLMLIIFVSVLCIGLGAVFTEIIGNFLSKKINEIDYILFSKIIFIGLILLIFAFNGFEGLLIAFVSCCIGLIALYSGTKRSNCMACLMFPTIAYYMF